MDNLTYRYLNQFCQSIGLIQGRPNGAQDFWTNKDGSLTCTSGGGANPLFFGGTLIRFDSSDGSFGSLIVESHDVSILDAKQAPNGAHAAVDVAYAAKEYMNNLFNPPKPEDANRSAH